MLIETRAGIISKSGILYLNSMMRKEYMGNIAIWEPKNGARPAAAMPDKRIRRDRGESRPRVTTNSGQVTRSQGEAMIR
jgi:hypothetical protein